MLPANVSGVVTLPAHAWTMLSSARNSVPVTQPASTASQAAFVAASAVLRPVLVLQQVVHHCFSIQSLFLRATTLYTCSCGMDRPCLTFQVDLPPFVPAELGLGLRSSLALSAFPVTACCITIRAACFEIVWLEDMSLIESLRMMCSSLY